MIEQSNHLDNVPCKAIGNVANVLRAPDRIEPVPEEERHMSLDISVSQALSSIPKISPEPIRQAHGAKLDAIARFQRVNNYLAAAEISLKQNLLMELPL